MARFTDRFGDRVVVPTADTSRDVILDADPGTSTYLFDPETARALAKALKKAAKRAEKVRRG